MHRRLCAVPILLLLLLLSGPTDTCATPLSVAYIDTVTSMEWAQVADATGYHYYQLETVCATDGSTACSSSLPGVELAGWTWATTRQVMELMMSVTGLEGMVRESFDPLYGTIYIGSTVQEADSTWAPQFLATFTPTIVTDTYQAVRGWAADGVWFDPKSAYLPEVIDAAEGEIDTIGRGGLSDSHGPMIGGTLWNPPSSERGAWLFRPVASVPEPSSLLLLSVGGVLGALYRRRTVKHATR